MTGPSKSRAAVLSALFCLALTTIVFVGKPADATSRKCPVFECLPYLLSTDISKISNLFNYESLIGITTQDDDGIEQRQEAVRDVCTSYMRFDTCFGGNWWECFDIGELLQVAKEAFSYLKLPGGGDLSQLTEQQVTVGLKVATFACANWDTALNNSYCIRSAIVRNSSIYNYFVQSGFDMGSRPDTISCDRFRELFHLFVYALATNCNAELANATNHVLTLGMQAIPTFNLSACEFMTFEEIMASKPDMSVLDRNTTRNATDNNNAKNSTAVASTSFSASTTTASSPKNENGSDATTSTTAKSATSTKAADSGKTSSTSTTKTTTSKAAATTTTTTAHASSTTHSGSSTSSKQTSASSTTTSKTSSSASSSSAAAGSTTSATHVKTTTSAIETSHNGTTANGAAETTTEAPDVMAVRFRHRNSGVSLLPSTTATMFISSLAPSVLLLLSRLVQ